MNNINTNQQRARTAGAPHQGGSGTQSARPDGWPGGAAAAPCTSRCPVCGRTLAANDLCRRLGDQAIHPACASHLLRQMPHPDAHSAATRRPTTAAANDDGDDVPAVRPDTGGPGRPLGEAAVSSSSARAHACEDCYPNHMQSTSPLVLAPGECRFDVRFPGWTIDVVAATIADAGWQAEEAVREHYPSETMEIRCASRRGCDHPEQWIQAWTVM